MIDRGDRMVLADIALADASKHRISDAMLAEDMNELLSKMKDLHTVQATVLVSEFILPDELVDYYVHEGDNSRDIIRSSSLNEKIQDINIDRSVLTQLQDTSTQVGEYTQDSFGRLSKYLANVIDMLRAAFGHYSQEDLDSPSWWWNGPIGVVIATGIPLVVVILVIIFWVGRLGESQFETCISQTFETASIARSINSSDVNGTLSAWNAVLFKIDECNEIRPEGVPNQPLVNLEREAQQVVDSLLNISRRDSEILVSFPSAHLTQAVLRGVNMYVLDGANSIVYEFQISPNGKGIISNTKTPISNMRQGAPVDQFTLDEIVDIAWAEDGSAFSQGNVLIAMDKNGVLVEHSPTILTRGSQTLLGTENWKNPIAIQIWRGNLYVLDIGANQIWRYSPTANSYGSPPTEYFAGEKRPNISEAVDFAIDVGGAVYVLFRNGEISKYVSGEVQPFAFANFPSGQELKIVENLFFSNDPISQAIYLVSRSNKTVYEVTHAGTFMKSYRIYNEDLFRSLSNVVVDPSQRLIYALSGNTVLVFSSDL